MAKTELQRIETVAESQRANCQFFQSSANEAREARSRRSPHFVICRLYSSMPGAFSPVLIARVSRRQWEISAQLKHGRLSNIDAWDHFYRLSPLRGAAY